MATNKGYLRIDGLNLCYTDSFGNKHSLPYDSGYSTAVGVDKAGYIRLDETDVEKIYYIDEQGTKRRTDYSIYGGASVGVDKEGSMWIGDDGYLRFINHIGDKRKIDGTITPTVGYLCFTANTSGSTVELDKINNPTTVYLEYSYDGTSRIDYTFGNAILLSNVGDKVYFRNKSETPTGFSTRANYYKFVMTGSISASGDINYLLCKNSTTTITSDYCFSSLFLGCYSLTTAPKLPATDLRAGCYYNMFARTGITEAPDLPSLAVPTQGYAWMFWESTSLVKAPELPATSIGGECYYSMFSGCSNLETLPSLPATTLTTDCYYRMFYGCSNIKLSTDQGGDYQIPYTIPTNGGGTSGSYSMFQMFVNTGGDWKGTPSINTTYYTSNTVI